MSERTTRTLPAGFGDHLAPITDLPVVDAEVHPVTPSAEVSTEPSPAVIDAADPSAERPALLEAHPESPVRAAVGELAGTTAVAATVAPTPSVRRFSRDHTEAARGRVARTLSRARGLGRAAVGETPPPAPTPIPSPTAPPTPAGRPTPATPRPAPGTTRAARPAPAPRPAPTPDRPGTARGSEQQPADFLEQYKANLDTDPYRQWIRGANHAYGREVNNLDPNQDDWRQAYGTVNERFADIVDRSMDSQREHVTATLQTARTHAEQTLSEDGRQILAEAEEVIRERGAQGSGKAQVILARASREESNIIKRGLDSVTLEAALAAANEGDTVAVNGVLQNLFLDRTSSNAVRSALDSVQLRQALAVQEGRFNAQTGTYAERIDPHFGHRVEPTQLHLGLPPYNHPTTTGAYSTRDSARAIAARIDQVTWSQATNVVDNNELNGPTKNRLLNAIIYSTSDHRVAHAMRQALEHMGFDVNEPEELTDDEASVIHVVQNGSPTPQQRVVFRRQPQQRPRAA